MQLCRSQRWLATKCREVVDVAAHVSGYLCFVSSALCFFIPSWVLQGIRLLQQHQKFSTVSMVWDTQLSAIMVFNKSGCCCSLSSSLHLGAPALVAPEAPRLLQYLQKHFWKVKRTDFTRKNSSSRIVFKRVNIIPLQPLWKTFYQSEALFETSPNTHKAPPNDIVWL